jgi:hypothetical protein
MSVLAADTGQHVRILFPGRICSDGGCDFQDAVLDIGGRIITGNIEVHVMSSQWYSHGHNHDKKYNDIVLHVVMWYDHHMTADLENGNTIPTVCLSSYLAHPLNELDQKIKLAYQYTFSCSNARVHFGAESLLNALNIAGRERFAVKAVSFQKSLMAQDADQILFRNIARALGYRKNTGPFEKVADNISLRTLEKIGKENSVTKQALILGTAGLLPSQRLKQKHKLIEEFEVATLERIWQSSDTDGTINQYEWCFFRVRPDNFPTRRLVALSYLVDRYCQCSLLQGILNLIREAPGKSGHHWIEDGLIIQGQGYWANHIDFGTTTKRSSALLGHSKAAEITINVVLPFAYAWGELYSEHTLQERAIDIYNHYPGLEDNQLIGYMKQQLLIRPDFRLSCLQQQGLLHIFKTYCYHRDCSVCPITFHQN